VNKQLFSQNKHNGTIMTKTKIALAACCILAAVNVQGQYNLPQSRIWAMGNKTGLDFTNLSNPLPIVTNLQNANEAAASVCDTAGQLLFYTNGVTVWNKNGVQMPHGAQLTGTGSNTATQSTTQGAVIVPMPDSAGKYYLFSLTQVTNCRLFCNKIDMSKDNGLGDVDTTFPLRWQSLADSALTEKMTAVPGCNNSVWLVVHSQNTAVFRAYHITTSGVNLTPVFSAVGSFAAANYQQGVMKFSPLRNKLLTCNFKASNATNAGVEVFDFDYATGIISNAMTLDNNSHYGGSFSPDGTKVYASSTINSNIVQWDLTAANPVQSKITLGASGQYADMKLGPDGKIYFGALAGSPGYSNYRYMGRIGDPNNAGTGCNFKDSVTALLFPSTTSPTAGTLVQGLPNDVAVPIPSQDLHIRSLDSTICSLFQAYTVAAPTGYNNRQWDNGDTTATRTLSARGTYWVRSAYGCDMRTDTFILRGADMPALTLAYANLQLTATAGFSAYQWYKNGTVINGATNNSFTANGNGVYSVKGIFGSGCSDSASYNVTDITGIENISANSKINIYPNPAKDIVRVEAAQPVNISLRSMDGKEVLNVLHTNAIDISKLSAGMYFIRITDDKQHLIKVDKLIRL